MPYCRGCAKGWMRDYSTDAPGERWVCVHCLLPSKATAIRLGEIEPE